MRRTAMESKTNDGDWRDRSSSLSFYGLEVRNPLVPLQIYGKIVVFLSMMYKSVMIQLVLQI